MDSSENENHPALQNKVVLLNGFTNDELVLIMRTIKGLCKKGPQGEEPAMKAEPGDLIFAKTTPTSLNTVLKDLIIDMSADHEYLKQNPPQRMAPPKS